MRYSVHPEHARRVIPLQRRPQSLTFLIGAEIVAQQGYAARGVRLVQDPQHLPPTPKPRHERFVQLSEVVVDRFGEASRRYVEQVERKAPHAPLALLREVLARNEEYDTAVVAAAFKSLVELSIVKRGTLSMLCHRFGGTPKLTMSASTSFPHIDVEQRRLSDYDEAVA